MRFVPRYFCSAFSFPEFGGHFIVLLHSAIEETSRKRGTHGDSNQTRFLQRCNMLCIHPNVILNTAHYTNPAHESM